MEVIAEDGKVESREVRESKGKKKKQKNNKEQIENLEEETGCWIALRIFGSCISSRSKVDSSISGTSINYGNDLCYRKIIFLLLYSLYSLNGLELGFIAFWDLLKFLL